MANKKKKQIDYEITWRYAGEVPKQTVLYLGRGECTACATVWDVKNDPSASRAGIGFYRRVHGRPIGSTPDKEPKGAPDIVLLFENQEGLDVMRRMLNGAQVALDELKVATEIPDADQT